AQARRAPRSLQGPGAQLRRDREDRHVQLRRRRKRRKGRAGDRWAPLAGRHGDPDRDRQRAADRPHQAARDHRRESHPLGGQSGGFGGRRHPLKKRAPHWGPFSLGVEAYWPRPPEMLQKTFLTWLPRMISTTMTTTAIKTRFRAYSTIPCPSSRLSRLRILL